MKHTNRSTARETTTREDTCRDEMPLACDLGAIEPRSRAGHQARAGHLLRDAALERRETPDGYYFRFHADDFERVVEFIANERLCCPFLRFVLEVHPAKSLLSLQVNGNEQAKAILRAELNLP